MTSGHRFLGHGFLCHGFTRHANLLLLAVVLVCAGLFSSCDASTPRLEDDGEKSTEAKPDNVDNPEHKEARAPDASARIEQLETRVVELEGQVARLSARLDKLSTGTAPDDSQSDATKPGYLTVYAKPAGQVYIDGKLASPTTPLERHELAAGMHTVKIFYPNRPGFSETRRAAVGDGRHVKLFFHDKRAPSPKSKGLKTKVRAQPYYQDGEVIGIRLLGIRRDTVPNKAGLFNGDIIKELDGQPVTKPEVVEELLASLEDGETRKVTVQRRDKEIELELTAETPDDGSDSGAGSK